MNTPLTHAQKKAKIEELFDQMHAADRNTTRSQYLRAAIELGREMQISSTWAYAMFSTWVAKDPADRTPVPPARSVGDWLNDVLLGRSRRR